MKTVTISKDLIVSCEEGKQMDICNDTKSLNNYFSVLWDPQQIAARLGIVGRPKGVRRVLEGSASHLSRLGSGTLTRRKLGSSINPKWLEPRRTF